MSQKSPGTSLDSHPHWVRDAVFYQIFPDRFAQAAGRPKPAHLEAWEAPPTLRGFKGGDLQGIAERLDELCELGINALYLTPIFASAANHRYHTYDYFSVDPLLGGDAALRHLLDAAHSRGVRVVLDGVFNHASRGFFQFNHVLENGATSPYRSWFHFDQKRLDAGVPLLAFPELDVRPGVQHDVRGLEAFGYDCWWNLPELPKFNTDNPEVREFLFAVAEHWLRFGIDGWRLDVPNEIDDDDFWREFRRRVKAINPDAYIVGEIWENADRWLQGDQFDAVMNYELGSLILRWVLPQKPDEAVVGASNYARLETIPDATMVEGLQKVLGSFSSAITLSQMNMLGSHDTPRLHSLLSRNTAAHKLAASLQFCMPGAPCVYYGDEIGMEGGHDPDCRRTFPTPQNMPAADSAAAKLRQHYRALTNIRAKHLAMRAGLCTNITCADDVLTLERQAGQDKVVIIANRSLQERVVPSQKLGTILFGEAVQNGAMLTLPGQSLVILG